jgi:hypothetical protein
MKTKRELQGEIKSKGTAFVMYWFLGAHYAYLGKWGIQLAYWFTLGGLGMWLIVDLFRIGGLVKRYNNLIYEELEELEEAKDQRNLERLAALR